MGDEQTSIYEQIGGRPVIERVLRIFYDKAFAHPWLGQFFVGTDQGYIESQQADFLSLALGGPKVFRGIYPVPAHSNMFITAELWQVRCSLLEEAFREVGVDREPSREWLKIVNSFKDSMVKQRVEQCEPRGPGDRTLAFPRPAE